ncbi:MAG: MBL fold metallo-hydrolase [Halioglobus sp.]|nr:MBL fold metallo-hydrolase [Halioglobus sp.]
MNYLLRLTLSIAIAFTPLAALAQPATAPPSVTVTPIQGSLYLLQGKGGNVVASVGGDGILMIDDDYAEYAAAYHDALKSIAGTAGLPRFVVNTHWHFDHTGTNAYWGERGSVILAQTNVYERMSTRQDMAFFNRVLEPSPRAALPVVTYADSLVLHFNNDRVEVQHYPGGHTDGDSVVFFTADDVIHMGDHYFKDSFPFVDLGSGGNVKTYTANVAAVLQRIDDSTVVVPGHGALATKADLERFHHMLRATTARVRSNLEQGLSVEQISAQGLGPEWDSWDQGLIDTPTWIGFIAASIE